MDDDLLARLTSVCPVDAGGDAIDAAGRDWWPLAMQWARAGSPLPRPALVVRPTGTDQVAAVLALCHAARLPVTPVAGRTGVCGASLAMFGGVALDLCGLDGIVAVDTDSLLVEVRPGTLGQSLEDGLAGHDVTVGHWPQSMALSTVGGWLACRSAGQYSTRYGTIADMVAGLEVVLADGRVIRTGWQAPRSATGPDLTQLFVGSEGTLGVITSALLRTHPRPAGVTRTAFAFSSFERGIDACRRILRRGATPAALRLYDEEESARTFGVTGAGSSGGCVLVVVDEADPVLAEAVAGVVAQECAEADALGPGPADHWLATRFTWPPVHDLVASGLVVDTCEVGGRWSIMPALYRDCLAALRRSPGLLSASAHLSHAYGDGAGIYITFAGRPPNGVDGAEWYRGAWDDLMAAVRGLGGAISHHHGIGLNRARFLSGALGPAFATLVAMKQALDPRGILNPGKLGLPSPWGDPVWP